MLFSVDNNIHLVLDNIWEIATFTTDIFLGFYSSLNCKLKVINKFITIFIVFVIAFSACKNKEDEKKDSPKPATGSSKVDAIIVTPTAVTQDIEVPGSLAAFEETNLQPEVSGRVTGIYFKEGALTNKGSLLVKLYDEDLQAQLKKIQVQLSIAKKTEERQNELLKINGISQQDYDLSLLAVRNLQADIDILKTSIAKTELRAPFSGKIGLRNISLGAYINPQTIVATIREVNRIKLEFTVPERYSTVMQPGKQIQFSIDGSNKTFNASIIANENNIAENTRSLKVKALTTSADQLLMAGGFAKVKVTLGKNESALMIPTQAIIPQARNKKVIVYRSGIAVMEVVTTGIRDADNVEITSGLKAGDTILITGLLSSKPGSKIQLNTIKTTN